jgi:YjeF-related protein N-terminus
LEKSGVDQSAWFDDQVEDSEFDVARLAAILNDHDWLVDGLLGTGLSRPVKAPLRTIIEAMNHSGKPIFASDLSSGWMPTPAGLCAWLCAPLPRRPSLRPNWVFSPRVRPITPAISPSGTDQEFSSSFEQEDGATHGGWGMRVGASAYSGADRHAA